MTSLENNNSNAILHKSTMLAIIIVALVFEIVVAKSLIADKQDLQRQIDYNNLTQKAFVAPNSQESSFKPAEKKLLIVYFVDKVTQSLLSYSQFTIKDQFFDIQKYMSSRMLTRFNSYTDKNLKQTSYLPSSLFVMNKSLTEVIEQEGVEDEVTGLIRKDYIITVKGKRVFIKNKEQIKSSDEEIMFVIRETMISEANPYGFILVKFNLSKIKK